MKARGFTLIEISVVISISALLIPLIFLLGREVTEQYRRTQFELEVARATRTFSEELALDLRTMKRAEGDGLVLLSSGACKQVRWFVSDADALLRAACGETRAVAKSVSGLKPVSDGIWVTFSLPVRAGQTFDVPVFVAVPR